MDVMVGRQLAPFNALLVESTELLFDRNYWNLG
jgi:hypothetical protein